MTARAGSRGIIGLSVIMAVILAVLVSLGVWQLQRRVEKHAVIAALEQRLAGAAEPLPDASQWAALTPPRDEFRRVTFQAHFTTQPQAMVYTSGSGLRPDVSGTGAWIFTPARLGDGRVVVINRGFAPEQRAGGGVPLDRLAVGPELAGADITLTGYLRFVEKPGWLTAQADAARRLWFVRDHLAMARDLGWGESVGQVGGQVAPFYIDLEAPVPASGVPVPGPLSVQLKDNHLQYALTWFGLAAVVVVAFAVWLAGMIRGKTAAAAPSAPRRKGRRP